MILQSTVSFERQLTVHVQALKQKIIVVEPIYIIWCALKIYPIILQSTVSFARQLTAALQALKQLVIVVEPIYISWNALIFNLVSSKLRLSLHFPWKSNSIVHYSYCHKPRSQ